MINGYFLDGHRMAVFSADGAEFQLLGRFRLDKEVPKDAIPDAETRAEAEKLRKRILALETQVDEAAMVDLLQKLNGLTVSFETKGMVALAAEQREFYRASLHRAMHRLRTAMAIPV